jgi:hypothetical protein
MYTRSALLLSLFLTGPGLAPAASLFTAETSAYAIITGIYNLSNPGVTTGLSITGSANNDLQITDSTGLGVFVNSTVFPFVLGDPLALGLNDGLQLYTRAEAVMPSLGTAESYALASAMFTLFNSSSTDLYYITFDLNYSLFSHTAVDVPLTENASAHSRVDFFSNTIDFYDELFSDTISGGGTYSRADTPFFDLYLGPGASDTVYLFADSTGLGAAVELETNTPEPSTALASAAGLLALLAVRGLRRRLQALPAILLLGTASLATAADLASVSFVRIAQTGDDPPGSTGPLTGFDIQIFGLPNQGNAPAVDETRRVVFVGRDFPLTTTTPNSGVFGGSGNGVSVIADRSTPGPFPPQPLIYFSEPALTPFGTTFYAADALFRSMIYVRGAAAIGSKILAKSFDPVPSASPEIFNGVSGSTMSGVYISFGGDFPAGSAARSGLFTGRVFAPSSATIVPELFAVALSGDDPPGPVGPFDRISFCCGRRWSNCGASTAFAASDTNFNDGVFIGSFTISPTLLLRPARRTFRTVISEGDQLPNAGGSFTSAGGISYDCSHVLFTAANTGNQWGVYQADLATGVISPVVRQGQAAPSPIGTFDNYSALGVLSNAGFTVIYARTFAPEQAIFVKGSGPLRKVVGTGDRLDGKRISLITFGPAGVAGTTLAFGVEFTDGTQGIYRADLNII